jgi:hypothetical protein
MKRCRGKSIKYCAATLFSSQLMRAFSQNHLLLLDPFAFENCFILALDIKEKKNSRPIIFTNVFGRKKLKQKDKLI